MAQREILNPDVDVMVVLDELATHAVTDGHGLTLGDLAGHRRDRYLTLWRVLHLLGGLARRGMLGPHDHLVPVPARVQDNQAPDVFQAAHVLPCDFSVNGEPGVHAVFRSPIIRGNVKAHLFGRTNAVHGLVNSVDGRCEDTRAGKRGWRLCLHEAVERVLAGGEPAAVFREQLVPGYAAAVAAAQALFERAISAAERLHLQAPVLLQANGQPLHPRRQDFRIGTRLTDARARAANKAVLQQVFAEYRLGPAGLAPVTLARAAREADDWAGLERAWRAAHA